MLQLTTLVPLFATVPLTFGLILLFIRNALISRIICIIVTLVLFSAAIYFYLHFDFKPVNYYFGNFIPPFGIGYKVDSLSLLFLVLVTFVATLTSIWNRHILFFKINKQNIHIISSLLLLCLSGFIGIILTNDAFNLFVFLEISSLTSYILLAASQRKDSSFSALNYLYIGTVGASFYVFGIGILYMHFGILSIDGLATEIAHVNKETPALILAHTLITVGVLIKIGLIPLSFWMPKAYSNAPDYVLVLLGAIGTKVAVYVFIRIVLGMLGGTSLVSMEAILGIVAIMAVASMFIGGILSLKQTNMRLLLVFSSVSQLGFIIFGLIISSPIGSIGALMLVITHAITKCGLFMSISHINYIFGTADLTRLKGVASKIPIQFAILVFLCLSLAGIPGTSGFWGKFYLIIGSFASYGNLTYATIIAIIIVLASVLSFFYSWNLIYSLWANPNSDPVRRVRNKIPNYLTAILLIIVLINILITLFPNHLLLFIDRVVYFTFIQK